MQDIIQPVSREILRSELTKDKLLRSTNKSSNEIYVVTAHDSPNVMQEIGRLREIAFRYYGGGSGKSVDIANRWSEHIKSSLEIGTIAKNQLYTLMKEKGAENFTFELLEEVNKDKLLERESYWIKFYETDSYGLNMKG